MEHDLTCWMKDTRGDIPPKLVGASLTFYRPPDDSAAQLFVFGGRLSETRVMQNILYSLDLSTLVWTCLSRGNDEEREIDPSVPAARYFHSLDVYQDSLVLYGGMASPSSSSSTPESPPILADIHIFHVPTLRWRCIFTPSIPASPLDPIPRYAHVSAICGAQLVVIGGQDQSSNYVQSSGVFDLTLACWVSKQRFGSKEEQRGMYRSVCVAADLEDLDADDEEVEGEIVVYSNYNFLDVRRTLEVLTPPYDGDSSAGYQYSDRTEELLDDTETLKSPPGLRFPTGARVGDWLIISGIYLASSVQDYSIWALNLKTLEWSPLDLKESSPIRKGAWSKAVLDPIKNQFLVFGAKDADMVADYNKRTASFEQVVFIDLETFGIYRRPVPTLSENQVEMNLQAFDEGLGADLDVVCDDGRKFGCSRRLLEERWTWFADERAKYSDLADSTRPNSTLHSRDEPFVASLPLARLRNTVLHFPEPYQVVLAFLQWIYTFSLITPLQNAPSILSSLLIISKQYDIRLLQDAVTFRMHEALRPETAVGIAEIASICGCQSLLIRAQSMIPEVPGDEGLVGSEGMSRGGASGSSSGGGVGGGPATGSSGGAGSGPGSIASSGINGRPRNGSGPGSDGFTSKTDRSSAGGSSGSGGGTASQITARDFPLPRPSSPFPKIAAAAVAASPSIARVKMPRRASDPPRAPASLDALVARPNRPRTRSSEGPAVLGDSVSSSVPLHFSSVPLQGRQRSSSGGRSLLRSPLSMSSSTPFDDAEGDGRPSSVRPERTSSAQSMDSASIRHPNRSSRSTMDSLPPPLTPTEPSTPFIPFPTDLKFPHSDIERVSISSSTKASFRIRPTAKSLTPSIASGFSSEGRASPGPDGPSFARSSDTLASASGSPPSSMRKKPSFAAIANVFGGHSSSSSRLKTSSSFDPPLPSPTFSTATHSTSSQASLPSLPPQPSRQPSLCLSIESKPAPPSPSSKGGFRMYGRGGVGSKDRDKKVKAPPRSRDDGRFGLGSLL